MAWQPYSNTYFYWKKLDRSPAKKIGLCHWLYVAYFMQRGLA